MKITTVILVCLAILCIVFLYVQSVRSINPNFEILQVPIDRLKPTFLDDKSPILIYTRIVTVEDILRTTFKYRYTSSHNDVTKGFWGQLIINYSRYALLHNRFTEDIFIDVYHAKHANMVRNVGVLHKNRHFAIAKSEVLHALEQQGRLSSNQRIKLPGGMVLILPYMWMFCVPDDEPANANLHPDQLQRVFVHDIFI